MFTGMVDEVLCDGERRQVPLGWDYDDVRSVVVENAASLDEVVDPRYVEWDLWDSNVMVRDGAIVSIIDHERAFFGDPLIEAGFAPTQLSAFGDAAAFMRGYGKGELTETEQVRRRLYSLHLVLVMVIETVYRGHADTKQYDWARHQLNEVMVLLDSASLSRVLGAGLLPISEKARRLAPIKHQHPTGESVVRDQPAGLKPTRSTARTDSGPVTTATRFFTSMP